MEEGIIKNRTETLMKELQVVISLAYIWMVAIGMLFEYQKYKLYGINIFQYADIFDFLIAPFRDTRIFIFVFISSLMVYTLLQIDSLAKMKYPRFYSKANFGFDQKSWFHIYRTVSFMALFVFYVYMSSKTVAKINQSEIADKNQMIEIKFDNEEIIQGKLIGKTKECIFLLSDKQVRILPSLSSVKEIILK